ncbi:unnamed protein product [Linum tenue]|uniref:Uncharacterized protein n=1 Tax=Linum tenue TaxID=586396 RepID=A0AAV0RNZ9_9ROSI|nr:unnamed protein product [Linum tenue]
MVWFWPNSDPRYKDIFEKEKPPFIPELDDPSFTTVMGSRDLPYGYWSHVVNCSSCNRAYKTLNAIETVLKVVAVGSIAVAAAAAQGMLSGAARTKLAVFATACYVASKWLAYFVYNNFRYHDYNHSVPEKVMLLARIWNVGAA